MAMGRAVALLAALAALAALGGAGAQNVSVVRLQLAYGVQHAVQVSSAVEYILEFVPSGDEGSWPGRVWLRAEGGTPAQPVLVTARQRTGAETWQLPYMSGALQLHQLERTLCPDDAAEAAVCESGEGAGVPVVLHVSAACARAELAVRVQAARDWRLQHAQPTSALVALSAPRVFSYRFAEGEDSVRLLVASPGDACATLAVLQYACPMAQTLAALRQDLLQSARMTVQRSGAVQLARSNFPSGAFLVAALLHDTDEACTGLRPGERGGEQHWLWEAAWEGARGEAPPPRPAPAPAAPERREKTVVITLEESLSLREYWVACGAVLGVLALMYAGFAALLAARARPACAPCLAPTAHTPHTPHTPPAPCLAPTAHTPHTPHTPPAPCLAPTAHTPHTPHTPPAPADADAVDAPAGGAPRRHRRDSNTTFDSSDMSDSDSEEESADWAAPPVTPGGPPATPGGPPATPVPDPARGSGGQLERGGAQEAAALGDEVDARGRGRGRGRGRALPARLRLAALARRRARVLLARSDRYLHTLAIVAVFYALPVVQFVVAFQMVVNAAGSLDTCYYNYLCAQPLGALWDFNHVASNAGYLLLGALFVLQVQARRNRRRAHPPDQEYGIPAHYGLLTALGVCLVLVGIFSAVYHVCPNRLNFQFDTAFMYVLAVLCAVKVYQARHPDLNARAHSAFGALAGLIALAVWGVLGGGAFFWALFTLLHVATFLALSLRIYYLGQFRLEKHLLRVSARRLVRARPLYRARLGVLLLLNLLNWSFALYGLLVQPSDFASHLLQVVLANTLAYTAAYLGLKLAHGERPRWHLWAWLGAAAALWPAALYMFSWSPTHWALPAAQSRHLNHGCLLLRFYDSHDLWHLLSAAALYATLSVLLTWDDGLAAVKRTDIPVF